MDKKWKVLYSETSMENVIDKLAKKLQKDFGHLDNVVLLCILKGAVYFTVDISRKLKMKHKLYFLEVSSYKDEMKRGDNTYILNDLNQEFLCDKHVIILDELCDTGHTLKAVKDALLEILPEESITTCVMMKKNIDSVIIPDYMGIDKVPNLWLKGYGLDNKGFDRETKEVYYLS